MRKRQSSVDRLVLNEELSLYYKWPWWKRRIADVTATIFASVYAAFHLRHGWTERVTLHTKWKVLYRYKYGEHKPIWYTLTPKEPTHE